MQKRFWAKDQNKDDGLQEDLDNDSEYKTDDKTEEKARRSASCILFFSAIVKTQYAANIANFNIIYKNHITVLTAKLQNCNLQYNDCLYTFIIICL